MCAHPQRVEIDKALIDSTGYREIADRFGLSRSAVHRHRENHLSETLRRAQAADRQATVAHGRQLLDRRQAQEDEDDRHALDVTKQLKAVNAACLEVLREARANNDPAVLLRAVDRITRQIELQAKLLGEIQDTPTVNIAILPEWHGLRQVILDALTPYPDAKLAVVGALEVASP
ncbi:MAG: hypothetical protein AAGC60_05570 [Acidobacteriota bacterium]